MSAILAALKALVKKVPWNKVVSFLKWAAEFAVAAGKKTATETAKILAFIKNNPQKVIDWFVKGYSIYEIIKMILEY
ncbi:AMEP412 family response elicitor [Paenibacillus larvae]|nr:AMEP412 family response elicitor [Paenibacillus larvae]MDT2263553.1 AMEP412 family response elicitor [Paenibacillus larvae]